MSKLSFRYIPLTFISGQKEIQRQIRNTIVFNYLLKKYDDVRIFSEIIGSTQYGLNTSALEIGSHKFLRISDIKEGHVDWDTVPFCDCQEQAVYKLYKGDILIARTGGTTGKSYLIDQVPDNAVFAGYLIRLRAVDGIDPIFIYEFLNSYAYWSQILEMKMGSAQPNVNAEKLKELRIPCAPPQIQKEIVKLFSGGDCGLNELISLLDRGKQFHDHTYELTKEFNSQLDLIIDLRQAILQDGIQGNLTEFWRNENQKAESALVLLERIREQRIKSFQQGKMREPRPLAPIRKEEMPYELPPDWTWCRLGLIIELISGQHINNTDYNESGVGTAYLTGPSDFGQVSPIVSRWTEKPKVVAKKDDILITVKGSGVGKLNILDKDNVAIGRQLMAIRSDYVDRAYIYFFLLSDYVNLQNQKVGIAIPGISREDILDKVIPIPSVREQSVIVSKVKELMRLCDELEAKVTQSQQDSGLLMESVFKEIVEEEPINADI